MKFFLVKYLHLSAVHLDPVTGVSIQMHLHCSGAEVMPDSLTFYTVPVQEVYRYGIIVAVRF